MYQVIRKTVFVLAARLKQIVTKRRWSKVGGSLWSTLAQKSRKEQIITRSIDNVERQVMLWRSTVLFSGAALHADLHSLIGTEKIGTENNSITWSSTQLFLQRTHFSTPQELGNVKTCQSLC